MYLAVNEPRPRSWVTSARSWEPTPVRTSGRDGSRDPSLAVDGRRNEGPGRQRLWGRRREAGNAGNRVCGWEVPDAFGGPSVRMACPSPRALDGEQQTPGVMRTSVGDGKRRRIDFGRGRSTRS